MSSRKLAVTALVLSLAVMVGACNLPLGSRTAPLTPTEPLSLPDLPTLTPSVTPRPPQTPMATPLPTATITETATPAPPFALAGEQDVVCYFGPGEMYSVDGALLAGERTAVLGKDSAATWLEIANPRRPRKNCWVPVSRVTVEGDLALAPVVPAPASIVTAVEVVLDPPTINVPGCVFPVTFDVHFSITTTGPATVTFQRFLSDGLSAPPETVTFTSAGTQQFSDYYRVGSAGEHWFGVRVTSPNNITGKGYGKAVCP